MRLDHLLSKDRSKGCVSGKLSCVKNPVHFETVPDLIELSLSGGDARRGNTRSHPEHDG